MLTNLLDDVTFILERLDWLSVLDIALVTLVFFAILLILRDTQAVVLLRGVFLLVVLLSFLISLLPLPAFSLLIRTALPALLFAIPVIFAPEIRRALERIGRASTFFSSASGQEGMQEVISILVRATSQLSERRHGALIVIQRLDGLQEYVDTGIPLNAKVSQKLLLQIFYPSTPLHDGAVIISEDEILAATCVMPLATGDIQTQSPERQMGLRHRAAIGISEVTDAVAVVVSEETGAISVTYGGRIIRRLDATRLENILIAFFRPLQPKRGFEKFLARFFQRKEA